MIAMKGNDASTQLALGRTYGAISVTLTTRQAISTIRKGKSHHGGSSLAVRAALLGRRLSASMTARMATRNRPFSGKALHCRRAATTTNVALAPARPTVHPRLASLQKQTQ